MYGELLAWSGDFIASTSSEIPYCLDYLIDPIAVISLLSLPVVSLRRAVADSQDSRNSTTWLHLKAYLMTFLFTKSPKDFGD
jgi:hypothetical protein